MALYGGVSRHNVDQTILGKKTFSGTVDLTGVFQIGGVTVAATAAELDRMNGITSSTAELNILDGVLSTAAELNLLDGALIANSAASVAAMLDADKRLRTNANVGTVPGTVTAVEYGDGYNHVTVLTVAAAVLVPDIPADAEEVGALVYTFPAGVHVVNAVHMKVTAATVGANTNAVDIGCGSTLAAGDGSTLQAASDEDFLDGQTIADISSPAIEKSLAADGVVFEAGDSKLFHINLAGTWTGTEADPDVTGTITIYWTYLGA